MGTRLIIMKKVCAEDLQYTAPTQMAHFFFIVINAHKSGNLNVRKPTFVCYDLRCLIYKRSSSEKTEILAMLRIGGIPWSRKYLLWGLVAFLALPYAI